MNYNDDDEDDEEENLDYYMEYDIINKDIRKKYDRVEFSIYFYIYDNEIREMALMQLCEWYFEESENKRIKTTDEYTNILLYLIWDRGNKEENLYLKTINMKTLLKPLVEYPDKLK